MPYWIIDVFY